MHSTIKFLILLITLCCWGSTLSAQQFQLTIQGTAEEVKEIRKFTTINTFSDSLQMLEQINELYRVVQLSGRLQAEFKKEWSSPTELVLLVSLGSQFKWLRLTPGNVDPSLLRQAGFKERFFKNKPFHYREVAKLLQELVKYSSDLGYPFASVRLDSVEVHDAQVTANLNYLQGPYITFDSIKVSGDLRLNEEFLQTYLRIQPNAPFEASAVAEIRTKMSRLPYLTMTEFPQLSFQNNEATTHLSLTKRPSNQIDGIIGFLPNAKNNGELLLTGQFNLLLQNMFGAGRRLKLQWESFKPQSQLLELAFYQPLLLRSPINTNLGFKSLKEDSTFVNTQFEIDFSYLFKGYGTVRAYSRIKSTRLSATTELIQATVLPDLADFDLTEYGLGYEWSKLNDISNPTRGTLWDIRLAAGTKKLRRNSSVSDSLYNDVDFQNAQATWEAQLQKYWQVGPRFIIASKARGGGVYNKRLFFNDLFRLGGLKSIRGFSENSFFAAEYLYTTIEPRFFIDTNSYLFVFYDQAWSLKYELENETFKDTPRGLGAGINLTTSAGSFNFAWAIGKSKQQDIGVQQSKIHFGYITKF